MLRSILFGLALLLVSWAGNLPGLAAPEPAHIPPETLSPDHRYGVTVPERDDDDTPLKDPNKIIEVKTGRVVGVINADGAFEQMNHDELVPACWSADNSLLLWQVDGKWGFRTEMLIHLEDGKIKSQVDILQAMRKEILQRVLQAVPDKYAAVKKEGEGDGSWWQDGFAIDCVLDEKSAAMKFPLIYHVFLTSDPKGGGDGTPVDARMTAEVSTDGTVKVTEFHLGDKPAARNW